MKEKEIVLKIMVAVWELFKKYGFKKLSDAQWDRLLDEHRGLQGQAKKKGKVACRLYDDMSLALFHYYEGKAGKGRVPDGQMVMEPKGTAGGQP